MTLRVLLLPPALLTLAACWSGSASVLPQFQSPQAAIDSLLDADRRFSAAADRTTLGPALTAMFTPDVFMQAPGRMVRGIDAATEALTSDARTRDAKVSWAPVRAGVSADGQHGFTFGFMTLVTDAGEQPGKYLAYWVKVGGQWRVAAYKRRLRPAGEVSTDLLPPAAPDTLFDAIADPATLSAHRKGLIAAEQAFSDLAQQVGLGPAFTRYGWADAMNLGGPDDAGFVIGNEHIGQTIGAAYPEATSPLYWSADNAIVASSGDLGVTIGHIRLHPKDGQPDAPPIPFFTIWRKDPKTGVWKYIAE